jgi:sugar lactone lactonase YvrE
MHEGLPPFEIAADGSLSNQRVWADLYDGVPDGICLDAENAVWGVATRTGRVCVSGDRDASGGDGRGGRRAV